MNRTITVYEDMTKAVKVSDVNVADLSRPDRPDEDLISQAKEALVYGGRLSHDQIAKAVFVLKPA